MRKYGRILTIATQLKHFAVCFFNHSERGMTGIEKPLVLPNHCTFQLDLNKRLINAANEGSLTKVRALLTEGASVNFCDADGKCNNLVTTQ